MEEIESRELVVEYPVAPESESFVKRFGKKIAIATLAAGGFLAAVAAAKTHSSNKDADVVETPEPTETTPVEEA